MRLEDYLTRNAANMPRYTALVDERRQIDHLGLLAESRALAASLQRRGLTPGDRVAVIMPNRVELIASAFACFMAGFVYQPINFRLSAAEVTNILDDAQPSALIVDDAAFPHHAALASRRGGLQALVTVGAEGSSYDWNDGQVGLDDPDAFSAPADPPPTAALLYTGGTTGTPKGTVLSHRAWVDSSRDGAWAIGATRRDVSYMCIPLFHVSFVHFLSAYYSGVPTLLRERVRPDDFLHAVVNLGVTHTALVQATLVDVLNRLEEEPRPLPRMTSLQYGGSPIAPAVIERVCQQFGDVLHQNYGSTEAGGAVTFLSPADHNQELAGDRWAQRVRSAGYAMPGQEMAIVDPDGRRLGPDEAGELRVRSTTIMDGYWGNEAATREALLPGGWLATGDIARIDDEGYLHIVDRKKDMIISGGENIYARDVEDTLLAHPEIREAAVVGGPNPRLGEEVVAYVVRRSASELTEADLLSWTTERLASYKKPARILFEDSLPRTPVGKIHKPSLRDRLRSSVDGPS